MLYENQRRWRMTTSHGTRRSSGSTSTGSTASSRRTSHAPRVREDFMSGVRSGVNGTPTFYVNGERHDDSYDPETLLAALERAKA